MKAISSLQFIKQVVESQKSIQQIFFREYQYPPNPPGTPPAKGDEIFSLSREKFLNNQSLESRIKDLSSNRNIGIESKLMTPSGDRHIPMTDLLLPKSPISLKTIVKIFKKIISPKFGDGAIFSTDNSYHFIGRRLLNSKEFNDFMAWSLLAVVTEGKKYTTIVDSQYVAYCLLKQSACLRITSYPGKNSPPVLVTKI